MAFGVLSLPRQAEVGETTARSSRSTVKTRFSDGQATACVAICANAIKASCHVSLLMTQCDRWVRPHRTPRGQPASE
jgi:hypothetical protein